MSVARIPLTPQNEQTLKVLGGSAFFLSLVHFLVGGFVLLFGCLGFLSIPMIWGISVAAGVVQIGTQLLLLLWALGLLAQGVLLVQTRSELMAVVTTDVGDQRHLSAAFAKLRIFFLLEAVLFAVLIAMSVLGFVTAAMAPLAFGGGL